MSFCQTVFLPFRLDVARYAFDKTEEKPSAIST